MCIPKTFKSMTIYPFQVCALPFIGISTYISASMTQVAGGSGGCSPKIFLDGVRPL